MNNLEVELEILQGRLAEVRCELAEINNTMDENDLRDALAGFTPIWDQLFPQERERILRLLIERITYDPDSGDVDLDLRSCGIRALADEARRESA